MTARPHNTDFDSLDLESARAALRAQHQQLEHHERQLEAMSRISAALFSQTSLDDLMRETLTVTIEVVGADAGSLQMYDSVRDVLTFRTVVGPASERLVGFSMPASQGISGRVFRTGQPDLNTDVQSSVEFNRDVDAQTGFVTRSMATVPIKRPDGPPIGVMQILNFAENYDSSDLEVLLVLSGQAAMALENARLAQSAQQAAMVNLIGDVSHDIKNMLTPIQTGVWTLDPLLRKMFADLEKASATLSPEDAAKIARATEFGRESYEWILQNALDAAERVQIRTKEIADAVKGISTPPRFVEANFNALCEEVATALRLVAYDSHVELELDLDPMLSPVEFDHKLLYNALYNLVNNAIPETPDGGRVTIRTRAPSLGDLNFTVEVEDTGRGMLPQVRDRLFTEDSVSTKPGGTGLGTRIVADVVRRHRGHIAVGSEPGAGTTFTLLLPVCQNR